MSALLRRTSSAWRWWTERFPLDAPGAVLFALGWVAAVGYGVWREDHVLLVVGAVALIGVGACALAVVVGALGLWLGWGGREAQGPLVVECGHPFSTGFELRNPWWNPLVDLEWTWESPSAEVRLERSWGRVSERVVLTRRGEYPAISRRFVVADVFGLCSVTLRLNESRRVRATPTAGALKQMHVVQGMAGGDALSHPDGPASGDRYDMRHYSSGDPIRFVLWKVFAKSRTLVIRTPEHALSPVQQTVAFLVSGEGDEPAAGAARVAMEAGSLGADWVLGADGAPEGVSQRSQAMELLVRSAGVSEQAGGADLGRFLTTTARGGARRALVFCPSKPGPWLDRVVTAARARTGGMPLDVLVCADGVRPHKPMPWWKRVLLVPEPVQGATRTDEQDIAKVVGTLQQAGVHVKVVDRAAGRVHPAGHLTRWGGR